MKKNKSRKRIILISILIIILMILIFPTLFVLIFSNTSGTYKVVATKIINEDEQKQKIKYTIKFKNYEIESAIKEIKCNTLEEVQREYSLYKIINDNEDRGFELELKKKTLTVKMNQSQFLKDIEYDEMDDLITVYDENNQTKLIVDQIKMKECLQQQGYLIK